MKPWAKLEVDYITHPKFLALTAPAICLWLEGKNYCDKHHTDGVIPKEALKTFRFMGPKPLGLLVQSAGKKPGSDMCYAPLWTAQDAGYAMTGYLEYNDPSEKVRARIEEAEDTREAHRRRQWEYRQRKRAEQILANRAETDNALRHEDDNARLEHASRMRHVTTGKQKQ